MPRTLVRAPEHNRHRSLGWLAVAWIEWFVRHGPGDVQGQPLKLGDEFTLFVVDCYAVGEHPSNNHMSYDSAFFSRPKGCNKSGLGAALALFEALGPARFAGWAKGGEQFRDQWGLGFAYTYEAGEPMGKPITAPMIRCMATEETQTGNVYQTIHFNLTDVDYCPLAHVPGVDPGLERVLLPWGGDIRVSTASSSAKDGGKETFARPPAAQRRGAGQRKSHSSSSMSRICTTPPSCGACTRPSSGTSSNAKRAPARGR